MAVPQLQLANLGEIYAQNQAKQAAMDTMQLEQAAAVEKMRQDQLARQKQSQLLEMAKTVDISTPEGAKQAFQSGLLDLGAYQDVQKAASDMALTKQRTETARIQGETSLRTASATQRKADAQIAKWGRDSNLDAQRTAIAWQQMRSTLSQQQIEMGANVSRALAGISDPKQRQSAYTQSLPILRQAFPDFEFSENVDDPDLTAAMAVMGGMGKPQKGTTININQGGGSYFKEVGKGFAQQDIAAIEAAKKAPDQVRTAQSVIDIVNQGKAIIGTGADIRTNIAKGFATVGLTGAESVAATEQLSSVLAQQTLDSIQSSGLGAGQGFTNTDREFLKKAAAGEINFTPEGLLRIAELNKKTAAIAYNKGQEALSRINQNPEGAAFLGNYQLPPLEQQPTPAGSGQGGIDDLLNRYAPQ
jgi:hypothetical protein